MSEPCLNAEEIKVMAREIHSIPGMGWIHTDVHEQIITDLVKQLHTRTRAQPIAPAPGVGDAGRTDAEAPYWLLRALAQDMESFNVACQREGVQCSDSSDCITEWCTQCAARAWLKHQRELETTNESEAK